MPCCPSCPGTVPSYIPCSALDTTEWDGGTVFSAPVCAMRPNARTKHWWNERCVHGRGRAPTGHTQASARPAGREWGRIVAGKPALASQFGSGNPPFAGKLARNRRTGRGGQKATAPTTDPSYVVAEQVDTAEWDGRTVFLVCLRCQLHVTQADSLQRVAMTMRSGTHRHCGFITPSRAAMQWCGLRSPRYPG